MTYQIGACKTCTKPEPIPHDAMSANSVVRSNSLAARSLRSRYMEQPSREREKEKKNKSQSSRYKCATFPISRDRALSFRSRPRWSAIPLSRRIISWPAAHPRRFIVKCTRDATGRSIPDDRGIDEHDPRQECPSDRDSTTRRKHLVPHCLLIIFV